MRAGGLVVHLGRGDSPILITDLHDVVHLFFRAYIALSDVVDEDALYFVGFDVQVYFARVQ